MQRERFVEKLKRILKTVNKNPKDLPAPLEAVYVFGSFARGALKPHDLDLLVVHGPPDPAWWQTQRERLSPGNGVGFSFARPRIPVTNRRPCRGTVPRNAAVWAESGASPAARLGQRLLRIARTRLILRRRVFAVCSAAPRPHFPHPFPPSRCRMLSGPSAARAGGNAGFFRLPIRCVSGGRGLGHFADQGRGWSAVVRGGRPAAKWRPGTWPISLKERKTEG